MDTSVRCLGTIQTHNLIDFMLDRTLRVEAATDERPAERERLRGIKRDDSIIRSVPVQWCRLRTWPAVCSIPALARSHWMAQCL